MAARGVVATARLDVIPEANRAVLMITSATPSLLNYVQVPVFISMGQNVDLLLSATTAAKLLGSHEDAWCCASFRKPYFNPDTGLEYLQGD